MDFIAQLSKEHSRSNTDKIVKEIGSNANKFKKIVDILYSENAPIPQRASWILPTVNKKHPKLLTPYIPWLIDSLKNFKVDGIKRNILMVIASHNIPENLQGSLVDQCFELLLSTDETVAVKVHAMQIIANISHHHPELQNELRTVIEDQLPKNSIAFHARAKRVLKELQHIKQGAE